MFSIKVFNSRGRFVGMASRPQSDTQADEIAKVMSGSKRGWRAEIYVMSKLVRTFVDGKQVAP